MVEQKIDQNFVSWHFTRALPDFINGRIREFSEIIEFFNIWELLKNLFAPYRRLIAKPKTSLWDRISFNIISSFVGAGARLVLVAVGILGITLGVIYEVIITLIYIVIPLFSLPKYLDFEKNTFFGSDLSSPQNFERKLKNTTLFKLVELFFDNNFAYALTNLSPKSLNIPDLNQGAILVALSKTWPNLANYLEHSSVKIKQFEILVNYLNSHLENPHKSKPKPLGQGLIFGYTNTLDQFSNQLSSTRLASAKKLNFLIKIEKILTRPVKNNVILTGEPGVGRHNTLQELTASIERGQLPNLYGKRVMLLDTIALSATGKSLIDAKRAFEAVLTEAKGAGNIILAIDSIDKIAASRDGRIDLSDVMRTALSDNSLPIIGITTVDDFNKYIRPNTNFLNLFERIDIEEASSEETINILIGKAIEAYHKEKIKTLYSAICEIVDKSSRVALEQKQPEKAILLLEDAVSEAKTQKLGQIDINLIDQILSMRTKTPVGKIQESEAAKLKDLEKILHERIIGQDEAITEIAKAMRRARTEVEEDQRPIGSFLFLGPTGVGKTETAKALAEAYFGAENRMVRLDMTEFQGSDSLGRLIGDVGTNIPGILVTKIRENPYSLLLVDEFEKASREAQNLFLQIIDEGFLTDAFGKKVSFGNVIIIATSNAGAEFIRELVSRKLEIREEVARQVNTSEESKLAPWEVSEEGQLSKKLIDYVLAKGLFSPELINRFDATVVYQPLTGQQAVAVASLMLAQLTGKLKASKNIKLETGDKLAQIVAQKGFDVTFGARPMRRLIQDKIEDGIAKMIIEESVKNGDTISETTLLKFLS